MKRLIRLVAVGALSIGWQAAAVPAHASDQATSTSNAASSSCQLGNGVQHVINIVFDNTHFTRDNPNVPSDLEQMPALLNFLKGNGTLLANEHTPLIAHTATDILTSLTGVYGDRMGVPISNSFRYYLPPPTNKTSVGVSFAYWTAPLFDPTPAAGTDTTPNMLTADGKNAPAPWVPFTRAGCNVGGVSTANIELENVAIDIPTVFGATSTQAAEVAASIPDANGNPQPAFQDFVGIAIHCAKDNPTCSNANGGRPDMLPDEPGGYSGYQGLFGHKYVAPALGGITDINGTPITGFPGFDTMPAYNTLGYVAQMQEHGVPVTYGYISDGHAAHLPFTDANPWASGEANYVKQLKSYDDAFAKFFARLAKDGINRSNSVFIFTSDEGDHMIAGPPSPANCDGVNVPCNYALKGEVSGNLKGLTKTQFPGTTTNYSIHSDSAPNVYITGNPTQTSSTTRDLERAAGSVTATNPYTNVNEVVDNYLADQAQMKLLHMQTADPKRNSTFTMFAKPDYFLFAAAANCSSPCISVNPAFNWNHGDIAPEINTTWLGVVGPDVRNLGITSDVWTDHSDIRPTLMALTGLQDDYAHQGRPIAEIMTEAEQGSNGLAAVYKQINAPVGQLSLDSIRFATRAMLSTSPGDQTYTSADATISGWTGRRDALAAQMIALLDWTGPGAGPQNESQKAKLIAQGQELLAEVHAAAS